MAKPGPIHSRAVELLADGQWHKRDWLVRELAKMVPPGRALREVERRRQLIIQRRIRNGQDVMPGSLEERVHERDQDLLIASGQRGIALDTLFSGRRFEFRKDDDAAGTQWVRLIPPNPHPRTAARLARERESSQEEAQ